MKGSLYLAFALVCSTALARTPDGMLGAIRLPNDGRPAIVIPGSTVDVIVQSKGELSIEKGDELLALQTEWGPEDRSGVHARCQVPADLPAGAHTLVWTSGQESDRVPRSIFVIPAFPAAYGIACVSLPAADSSAKKRAADVVSALNASEVAFAIVFPEEGAGLDTAMSALAQCVKPTYIVSAGDTAAKWLGPATFRFEFGKDSYLAPAIGRSGWDDAYGEIVNTLAASVNAGVPARWSVCIVPFYDSAISMRNELTLFVDRPFNAVIAGPRAETHQPKAVAWTGWFPATPIYVGAPGQMTTLMTQNSDSPFKVQAGETRNPKIDLR